MSTPRVFASTEPYLDFQLLNGYTGLPERAHVLPAPAVANAAMREAGTLNIPI
jgi:energy-converting hydrogenase Eha subunit B